MDDIRWRSILNMEYQTLKLSDSTPGSILFLFSTELLESLVGKWFWKIENELIQMNNACLSRHKAALKLWFKIFTHWTKSKIMKLHYVVHHELNVATSIWPHSARSQIQGQWLIGKQLLKYRVFKSVYV